MIMYPGACWSTLTVSAVFYSPVRAIEVIINTWCSEHVVGDGVTSSTEGGE